MIRLVVSISSLCMVCIAWPLSAQQTDAAHLPPVIEQGPGIRSAAPAGQEPAMPAPHASSTPQIASSTSASKQFIVHGADLRTRSVFCLLADDTAGSLDRLLKDASPNRLPVVVVLKTAAEARRSGPTVTTNISQLAHGGFHLQVNVQLRQGFRTEDFNDELVRILLAERILRQHKELSSNRQRVLPDWLLTGVSQSLEFRNRARPSVMFAAVFRSGRVYSIDGVLQANASQLDSLSRSVYQTSCCALVLTLLDQPDGPVRFGRFLSALATAGSPDRELLQQHFPTLGVSSNSLEKWWALQMATLATPTSMEAMNVSETERYLDEALTLQYQKKSTPVTNPASKQEPRPAAESAPPEDSQQEKPTRFHLPFFKPRNKEIFFPFLKRDSSGETEQTPEKSAEKAEETPAKPIPSLPKKPANERKISDQSAVPAPPPPPQLPRKPESTRQISDTPVMQAPTAPPDAAATATEVPSDKDRPSLLNPLNWFKKDEKTPPSEEAAHAPSSNANTSPSPSEPKPVSELINIPITEYSQVLKREDRSKILQSNLERLNALKMRAHPLYRPLIGEYTEIVRSLMHGKDKGVSEKLMDLQTRRAAIHKQAVEVETYLDWYEASHTGGLSTTFDDYLRLQGEIEAELHPRNDTLSQYLDMLDKEYE